MKRKYPGGPNLSLPMVVIGLIRQVLVDQASEFHKPGLIKRALRRIAGQGLLTSDGPLWKQQRKLIQPAFRHDWLAAEYGDVISTSGGFCR